MTVVTPYRRILRTIVQVLAAAIPGIPAVAAVFDLGADQAARIAALIGAILVVVVALQNSLEGSGTVPTLLARTPPR